MDRNERRILDFLGETKKPLQQRVIEAAKAGISHFDLAKVIKQEEYKDDVAHDFPHTMRVYKVAEKLAESTGADKGVVTTAAAFHDLITRPKNDPLSATEATESANYASDLLESLGFSSKAILDIKTAIRTSAYVEGMAPETPEAKILYDADKLDQFGAIGIMRYFASGGKMDRPFYNEKDPFAQTDRPRQVFDYTLDAIIDRVPKVGQSLTTEPAKRIAAKRWKFFESFLEELKIEIAELSEPKNKLWNKRGGALEIMQVFSEAGKEAKTFYNVEDPFAKERPSNTQGYPVDSIVSLVAALEKNDFFRAPKDVYERKLNFLKSFLKELESEIEGESIVYSEVIIEHPDKTPSDLPQ